jgi:nucleoside-diphosphate-sugar epimerase
MTELQNRDLVAQLSVGQFESAHIVRNDNLILITGSNGFIGSRVVKTLLESGFCNLRCFVRPSSNLSRLQEICAATPGAKIEIISGNLLSTSDCARAAKDVTVVFHLAAGIEKSFAGSFMNSVVTTRNLLDAVLATRKIRRFVNVSSFAVYSNWNLRAGELLDESCELEGDPVNRAEAYAFAKLKQDQIVADYGKRFGLPYLIMRPGAVYGPGAKQLTARVGIDTFGIFCHLGGGNQIPLTYVDNCADAIVLAGLHTDVDGETFNIVDDDLPSSRRFLKLFKKHGRQFKSLYVPYWLFYTFCFLWESYSRWSKGQLPPAFNRRRCAVYWKGNRYANEKLKKRVGWKPAIPFPEASRRYFEYVRREASLW